MLLARRLWPGRLRLRPRLRDGAPGGPPALQGRLRFTDPGTDRGRYIRPLVASVEAGPDDDSLPGAMTCLRHPTAHPVHSVRLPDAFRAACTLWSLGSFLPRLREVAADCVAISSAVCPSLARSRAQ